MDDDSYAPLDFDPPSASVASSSVVPRARANYSTKRKRDPFFFDWSVEPPPSIVLLVAKGGGSGNGRWSDVWSGVSSSALRSSFDTLLHSTSRQAQLSQALRAVQADESACVIVGVALVQSWSFVPFAEVQNDPSDIVADMMAHLRSKRYARTSVGFVKHRVLDAAMLVEPFSCSAVDVEGGTCPQDVMNTLQDRLIMDCEQLRASSSHLLRDAITAWQRQRLFSSSPICSFVDARFAHLLLQRLVPCDVVDLVFRDKFRLRLHPSLPPKELEVKYMRELTAFETSLGGEDSSDTDSSVLRKTKRQSSGCIDGFSCHHLVRALKIDQHLKASGDVSGVTDATLGFLFPGEERHEVDTFLSSGGGVDFPSTWTLRRARCRLDIVSMIMARRHLNYRPDLQRYLCFDKSPQKEEVLACIEDVITAARPETAIRRSMPLTAMAFRHCGVIHVGWSIVHKAFLEAGPDRSRVDAWCSSVRAIVTDHSSVESQVVDLRNIVPSFLSSSPTEVSSASLEVGFLFPLAMRIIGVNHTLDSMLSHTLSRLPFFPSFQSRSKILCGFLRNRPYRASLILHVGGSLDGPGRHSLAKFSANFAKWRWGTMRLVCDELGRVCESLRESWDLVLFKGAKQASLDQVDWAVRDDTFWHELSVVSEVCSSLESFRTWCQACPCHEDECRRESKKGSTFSCPENMKSRRGPELWPQLLDRFTQWRSRVSAFKALASSSAANASLLENAFLTAEGYCRRKFSYCEQLPWLLWRVRSSRDIAQRCLVLFDSALAKDPSSCHRVSVHFLQPGSLLRSQVEAFAGGGDVAHFLSAELRSYELAPLDETCSEGAHRDVNNIRTHAPGSEVGWWAASVRLGQNLRAYDDFRGKGLLGEFAKVWSSYKSVLQTDRKLSFQLRQFKCGRTDFYRRVYLLGQYAHVDLSWLTNAVTRSSASARGWRADDTDANNLCLTDIKCDFLSNSLLPSRFYSIEDWAGQAQHPGADLDSFDGLTCFKVVESKIWKAQTIGYDELPSLRCPVMIQRFSVASAVRQADSLTSMRVFAFGDVEIVDSLNLAPWKDTSSKLLCWNSVLESTCPNCLELGSPVLASAMHQNRLSDSYPAFLMLCDLKRNSWEACFDKNLPPFRADGEKNI